MRVPTPVFCCPASGLILSRACWSQDSRRSVGGDRHPPLLLMNALPGRRFPQVEFERRGDLIGSASHAPIPGAPPAGGRKAPYLPLRRWGGDLRTGQETQAPDGGMNSRQGLTGLPTAGTIHGDEGGPHFWALFPPDFCVARFRAMRCGRALLRGRNPDLLKKYFSFLRSPRDSAPAGFTFSLT